jgi:3''5''-cyclic nucleotide phosphodiesterase.
MASHPRIPWPSHSVLWELWISHDTIHVVFCSVCSLEFNTFSFQNTSVLENHHWRSAIGCLLESNVAEQLGAYRLELEQQISSLILATDITRQQEFLSRFKVMNIAYSYVMCIIWLSTRFLLLGCNTVYCGW